MTTTRQQLINELTTAVRVQRRNGNSAPTAELVDEILQQRPRLGAMADKISLDDLNKYRRFVRAVIKEA